MPRRRSCEQIELSEIVVRLELGAGDLRVAGLRGRGERDEVGTTPAIRAPDEKEPSMVRCRDLVSEVSLDLVGEAAPGNGVSRPQAPVLDQEPVVDSAGGRAERLIVLAREVRAERPRLAQSAS